MTYKKYANKKDTPSRMARKHSRLETFLFNKRAAKLERKLARPKRKSLMLEEQGE